MRPPLKKGTQKRQWKKRRWRKRRNQERKATRERKREGRKEGRMGCREEGSKKPQTFLECSNYSEPVSRVSPAGINR